MGVLAREGALVRQGALVLALIYAPDPRAELAEARRLLGRQRAGERTRLEGGPIQLQIAISAHGCVG